MGFVIDAGHRRGFVVMGADTVTDDFGQWLRTRREDLRLTRQRVADRSGLSYAYLSQLESGRKQRPSRTALAQLAKGLEIPLDDLLAEVGATSDTTTAMSAPPYAWVPVRRVSRGSPEIIALHDRHGQNIGEHVTASRSAVLALLRDTLAVPARFIPNEGLVSVRFCGTVTIRIAIRPPMTRSGDRGLPSSSRAKFSPRQLRDAPKAPKRPASTCGQLRTLSSLCPYCPPC